MKYTLNLIWCFLLIFISHFCFAAELEWKKFGDVRIDDRHIELWARGGVVPSTTLDDRFIEDLKRAWGAPFLKDRLPNVVGVLVDAKWKKTSGYWSSTLVTPTGAPAILINAQTYVNPAERLRLLAHELTHLVHFATNPKEESWVREGLAMLVEFRVTGKLNPVLLAAKTLPETSLMASQDPAAPDFIGLHENTAQYGHVLEYFYYLYRLCGGERVVDALFAARETAGVLTIDMVLASVSAPETACANFDSSFTAFSKARFLQSTAKPSSYVWLTGLRATVRESAAELPRPFPRYSSAAYRLGEKEKACEKGDEPWGERRCIRVSR